MLVGNKCDLRQAGVTGVPTSYGEKLAMVIQIQTAISFGFILASGHLSSNLFMLCFVHVQQTYNTLFCETSAKDGSNTLEAVLHLAR